MKRITSNFNPRNLHCQHHGNFDTGAATASCATVVAYIQFAPQQQQLVSPVKARCGANLNKTPAMMSFLAVRLQGPVIAQVAQKLEQLEEFMGQAQEDGLTHIASETVHYNSSDLSTWLESMTTELNPSQPIIRKLEERRGGGRRREGGGVRRWSVIKFNKCSGVSTRAVE